MVLVIGEKEKLYMKKRNVKYTAEPLGKIKVVKDFLPKPEDLTLKDDSVKVTLALSKTSIKFFKEQAVRHHSKYQKMIRMLIDKYANHYKNKSKSPSSSKKELKDSLLQKREHNVRGHEKEKNC